jgi:hypothetical protein
VTAPPAPARPPVMACTLTGSWEAEQPHELTLVPHGKPFAKFTKPDSLKLVLGASAFVELTWKQLVASGVVASDKLVLHAAHPLLLAGYLAPGPGAVLRWSGGHAVTPELPRWIHPLGPTRTELDCGALALDAQHKFRGRDAITAPAVREMMLAQDVTVPVSLTADGPPIVELKYDAGDSPALDVLEERGDRVRVAVLPHHLNRDWDYTVIGWISASHVSSEQHGFGGSWGSGGGIGLLHPRPMRSTRKVVCSHSVELIGELDGELHPLGLMSQDVTFSMAKPDGELAQVWSRELPIEPVPNARLLVTASAVADCSDAP